MKRVIYEYTDAEILKLLGRKERTIDFSPVEAFYNGQTVLITGGAGSIGRELIRQILELPVKKVYAVDFNEYGIFDLQRRICDKRLEPVLLNVLDPEIGSIWADILIHASAYKHCPLLEQFKSTAYRNNVEGFYNTLTTNEFDSVTLVSTDKAVRPTSYMGETKRMCEKSLLDGSLSHCYDSYSIVRFGNVLQSVGSVVPIFLEQLADGINLTVTDKKIKRFFMSKKEAVGLTLLATAMNGNNIYTLEMGEQIEVYKLASALIKDTGVDVDIDVVGLRPAEKMFEELSYGDVEPSRFSGINISKE